MGTIATAGGPIGSAFDTFNKWLGHFRGGLSMAAVCSCAAFGAVCGDNIATAMTMDKARYPQMRKYGYKDTLSLGSIAAGGNLGIMIPPSAAFVVFSFIAQDPVANVADLFISGIIPGIVLDRHVHGPDLDTDQDQPQSVRGTAQGVVEGEVHLPARAHRHSCRLLAGDGRADDWPSSPHKKPARWARS